MAATDVATEPISATSIPRDFNVATWFVDRNVAEGRGGNVAVEFGPERITYRQVLDNVNRLGNALRDVLDVRIEERVLLLLLDCPEFVYSFFGAIKIGAVAVPTNTLWKSPDYEYILNDCRARVVIVSEALLPQLQGIPRGRLRYLREVIRRGQRATGDPLVRVAHGRRLACARGRADLQGRQRLLALLVRQYRLPQGLRAPAPRHGRGNRVVRPRRARHHRARPLLQRGQAVFRLRPGQRAVLPVWRGRLDRALSRAADTGSGRVC